MNGSVFYIEDVSIRGETERYGPFQLGQSYGARLDADKINWAAIQSEHASKYAARQNALKQGMKNINAMLKATGIKIDSDYVDAQRQQAPR